MAARSDLWHAKLYAVNLAFVEDGDVAIGVVGDGGSQCIHVAQRGEGAFTIENGNVRQIHASAASKVVDFEGFPPQGSARDRAANVVARIIALDTLDVRCLSSTLSLAYVAQGRIACTVLFAAPSVVHIAAGALLAAEAGALVVDVDARPWTTTATSLVAAADAATLEQVLKILDDGSDPSN